MEIPAVGARGNRCLENYIPMTFLSCTTDKLLLNCRGQGGWDGWSMWNVRGRETSYTRWFKYDRDCLHLFTHKSVLVIFEPPCTLFDGEPKRRPLASPRRWWKDNIKMNLKDMIFEGVDWIHLARDRGKRRNGVKRVKNFMVAYNSGYFLISWQPIGFWETMSTESTTSNPPTQNQNLPGYRPIIYTQRSSFSQDVRSPVRTTGRTNGYVLYTGRSLCFWYNLRREWTIANVSAHTCYSILADTSTHAIQYWLTHPHMLFNTGWHIHTCYSILADTSTHAIQYWLTHSHVLFNIGWHIHICYSVLADTSTHAIQYWLTHPHMLFNTGWHIHTCYSIFADTSTHAIQYWLTHPHMLFNIGWHIHTCYLILADTSTHAIQYLLTHPHMLFNIGWHIHTCYSILADTSTHAIQYWLTHPHIQNIIKMRGDV